MDAWEVINVVAKHDAALANKLRDKQRQDDKREKKEQVQDIMSKASELLTEAYELEQELTPGGRHNPMLGEISGSSHRLQVARNRYADRMRLYGGKC